MPADGVPREKTFPQFHGQLALTFMGCNKCNKISASTSKIEIITLEMSFKESLERNGLFKNSCHHQEQTEQQAAQINAMNVKLEKVEAETTKLKELLNLTSFTQAIMQVVSILQIRAESKWTGKNNQPAGERGLGGSQGHPSHHLELMVPWILNSFPGTARILATSRQIVSASIEDWLKRGMRLIWSLPIWILLMLQQLGTPLSKNQGKFLLYQTQTVKWYYCINPILINTWSM